MWGWDLHACAWVCYYWLEISCLCLICEEIQLQQIPTVTKSRLRIWLHRWNMELEQTWLSADELSACYRCAACVSDTAVIVRRSRSPRTVGLLGDLLLRVHRPAEARIAGALWQVSIYRAVFKMGRRLSYCKRNCWHTHIHTRPPTHTQSNICSSSWGLTLFLIQSFSDISYAEHTFAPMSDILHARCFTGLHRSLEKTLISKSLFTLEYTERSS